MPDEPALRGELTYPYRHPYRQYVPLLFHTTNARHVLLGGGAVVVGSGALAAATGDAEWLLGGVVAVLVTLLLMARWVAEVAFVVRRFSRGWDEPSELEAVRAQRPHRAERDEEIVHDEYAVTAEDSGHLFVWRFRPLSVDADPAPGELLVPGRPRHAAAVMEERPLEADAARAAEQLVEAQEEAARLEAEAREDAVRRRVEAIERGELERESASTAAALQHLTGQDQPRRGR